MTTVPGKYIVVSISSLISFYGIAARSSSLKPFVRTLAQNRSNIVVNLVRDKAATDTRLSKDGISNVTIIQADITDFAAPQKAAAETPKLTNGNLDFLINHAALVSKNSGWAHVNTARKTLAS